MDDDSDKNSAASPFFSLQAYNFFVPVLPNDNKGENEEDKQPSNQDSQPDIDRHASSSSSMTSSMLLSSTVSSRPYLSKGSCTASPPSCFFAESLPPKETRRCSCRQNEDNCCSRLLKWWSDAAVSDLIKPSIYDRITNWLERRVFLNSHQTCETEPSRGKWFELGELLLPKGAFNSIKLDIGRTYPSIAYFREDGKESLKRVLCAYAFYDPEVGYVQGMNFVVATLLWHANEQQAFALFVTLMQAYDLRCMFLPQLPGVFKRCSVLRRLLKVYYSSIYDHLQAVGVEIPLLASDWLMTLFAYSIPIIPLSSLWDEFFAKGWIVIYRLTLQRLLTLKSKILGATDVPDLMKVVKYGNPPSTLATIGDALLGLLPSKPEFTVTWATPNFPYCDDEPKHLSSEQIPSSSSGTSSETNFRQKRTHDFHTTGTLDDGNGSPLTIDIPSEGLINPTPLPLPTLPKSPENADQTLWQQWLSLLPKLQDVKLTASDFGSGSRTHMISNDPNSSGSVDSWNEIIHQSRGLPLDQAEVFQLEAQWSRHPWGGAMKERVMSLDGSVDSEDEDLEEFVLPENARCRKEKRKMTNDHKQTNGSSNTEENRKPPSAAGSSGKISLHECRMVKLLCDAGYQDLSNTIQQCREECLVHHHVDCNEVAARHLDKLSKALAHTKISHWTMKPRS